jgi:hypothetical protein
MSSMEAPVVTLTKPTWCGDCDDQINFTRKAAGFVSQSLSISFQRTVRISDGTGVNQLPPSLGNFPLFETSEYTDTLPAGVGASGGFLFPMYRKSLQSNKAFSTPANTVAER